MADYVFTVQDGLGLKDNPEIPSNQKTVVDYISAVDNIDDNFSKIKSVEETINLSDNSIIDGNVVEVDDSFSVSDSGEEIISEPINHEDILLITDNNINTTSSNIVRSTNDTIITLTDNITSDLLITINSPSSNDELVYMGGFYFSATATISGDPVNESNLIWESSIDGIFKRANNFVYNKLSVGTHTIKVSVDGEKEYKTVEIIVNDNQIPDRPENLTEI